MGNLIASIGMGGNSIVIAFSAALLFFGAEWLVRGGSQFAKQMGVKPLIVGLSIVAFGTSMPEFVVSLIANVFENSSTIAIGNIIGSNVTNIGLILGVSGLIFPITIHFKQTYKGLIFLFGISLLLYGLSLDGSVSRIDGLIMVLVLVGYIFYLYRHPGEIPIEETEGEFKSKAKNLQLVLAGSIALSVGAWLFVKSAVWIAEEFDIPKMVIGLTIVAVGTSLPELATSLVAAFRKHGEISVGNIIGSNIFNILFIMGGVGFIKPLDVLESRTIAGEVVKLFPHAQYIIMMMFGLVLIPLGLRHKIGRLTGTILVLGYFGFYVYLFYGRS
ncbi:MAG: calcium/sodium antiporter [Candidatus Marinimicrobia bacterium]|jgi:cation:H+ antiporter|nr:calcium/sodium antiporter [Candidatus Neomarinimicrobiota bacterium]MBT4362324.1 calcium/sodium antiporter [Candidatus Neomarinimicrobiota bacterium]MBT4715767.1 calcium/sodium antiporter [Candidatus Neomarinimicrobiota bacterium]MBT4947999.1 calcium/sodium antiporter [Candidatus Neomarinimicrobiota bacterium]MBT5269815.1 calcium/sodium antiporter [Candidatus Neomarinimicrobiota bacterium]